MERVDINLVLSKLRSKEDRINFMRETGKINYHILGFYMPTDKGFDTKFFVQVLKGQKNVRLYIYIIQLLRLDQIGGVDFPFFTKTNNLTKNHLLSYFMNDAELRAYLPDDINLNSIKRNYLLNVSFLITFQVLFVVKRNIYNELYAKYKVIKASRDNAKWSGYYVNLATGIGDAIKNYEPVQK